MKDVLPLKISFPMKTMTSISVLVSLAWMTAGGVCHADSKKPNVVFILSDNQSYYEMSCHGHADIKTPHIDRLADQCLHGHGVLALSGLDQPSVRVGRLSRRRWER